MSLVQHFVVHKGDSFTATITLTKDGLPIALTSETLALHVRPIGSATDTIAAQDVPILDGTAGKVRLRLTPTQTAALVDDAAYSYAIHLTDTGGGIWTVCEGRIYAAPAIDGV